MSGMLHSARLLRDSVNCPKPVLMYHSTTCPQRIPDPDCPLPRVPSAWNSASVAGSTGKHTGSPDLRPAVWLEASSLSPSCCWPYYDVLRLETSWKGPGAVTGVNPPKEKRLYEGGRRWVKERGPGVAVLQQLGMREVAGDRSGMPLAEAAVGCRGCLGRCSTSGRGSRDPPGHKRGSSEGSAELCRLRPVGPRHRVLALTEEGRRVPVPPSAAWCPRQQY